MLIKPFFDSQQQLNGAVMLILYCVCSDFALAELLGAGRAELGLPFL
jgi:hypothetical protein